MLCSQVLAAEVRLVPLPSSLHPHGGGRSEERTLGPRPLELVAAPTDDAVEGAFGEFDEASLLAAYAHELRAPVTAVAASAELLAEDCAVLDGEQARRLVGSIRRGAAWLQGLVENLLAAAQLGRGELALRRRPVELGALAREVAPVVAPLLERRGQRLVVRGGGPGTVVSGDARRLGQVLVNLVSNAAKYAGPGTAVEVSARARAGGVVRLAVADRGPGLPAGGAAALFEPYRRGPREMGGAGPDGLGLGLAIVRAIAEAHGGSAGASRRRGGGAAFWVELPALAGGAG
jgi:signal transduction histidine kinase